MTCWLSTVLVSTFDLFGGFQVSGVFGLLAHALHGIHHIVLLREERVSQVGRPLDVLGQQLDDIRQGRQSLDAGVPILLLHGVGQRLVFEVLVLGQPLLQLNDLQWIGGGHQHLAEQRIGVERDRRHQRIELVGRNLALAACADGASGNCV